MKDNRADATGQERDNPQSAKRPHELHLIRHRFASLAPRMMLAALLLGSLANSGPTKAGEAQRRGSPGSQSCVIEVLHSEELPIGPSFHHTIKAILLVIPPDRPPFQTTVLKTIPWQSPPPRQGQRLSVPCDPARIDPSRGLD